MPKIQDLTNDGPPQNILKRKLKRDDDDRPIDPKRTHMPVAADIVMERDLALPFYFSHPFHIMFKHFIKSYTY
jgi:hypothetical protein